MRRSWDQAIAKRNSEHGCRICGQHPVEAAHVIGRARDYVSIGGVVQVNPDSIVPLCRNHHRSYDGRELDLLPYLNTAEQAQAVRDAGSIMSALRRITSRRTP